MAHKKGFTLIELLIVMAILGILSAIGVSNFITARLKARDSARKSDLQTIVKTLEAYANDYRSYPATGDLPAWGQPFADPAHPETIYAARLPDDQSAYDYKYVSTGTSFTIYAHLENTEDPSLLTSPIAGCGGTGNTCNYKISSSNL